MERSFEPSLEAMTLTGQYQPSIPDVSAGDDLEKILAEYVPFIENSVDSILTADNPNDLFYINSRIDQTNDTNEDSSLQTQMSETTIESSDILDLLESYEKPEPFDATETVQQQSTFIECDDQTVFYQSHLYPSPPSVPVGSSPAERKELDNLLYTQSFIDQQQQLYKSTTKSKKTKNHQRQSTNVGPVDYVLHSGGCQPCTTAQMQTDYAYQQQFLDYNAEDSKKIQIRCQPRSKFRPRTQNESKTSSHYLRCEDGVKPEYPTVHIPQKWFFESDVNLIEVALIALDKQPHPYTLENKTSSDTYEDNVLIFKQGDPNVLYFRLTNEDFQNGYKTFMIELIKSKQDDVITKDLIRTRQLEHSMLRFTRIFQLGKGNFQRDEGSTEYSTVMSEAYGDVDIEHMGPRYGPMSGQEMVYIVLKGRILKNDIKIEITENMIGWNYSVDNFTKNGNVIYFIMPAFPYPQCNNMKATIIIYYKGEELSQSPYLYKGSLDQELAELRLNDSNSPTNTASSSMTNNFDVFNFLSATNTLPNFSSRRTSTPKRTKRLSNK